MLTVGGHWNGIDRAILSTKCTTDAGCVDVIFDQLRALAGRASAVKMCFIFVAKIGQGGEYGVGSRFSESADAATDNGTREFFEVF